MHSSSNRRHILATAFAALSLLVTPVLLYAHARLVKSTPAANARLDASPASVTLWFSEQPEVRFTTIELLDSTGAKVSLGEVSRLAGDASAVTVPVVGPLGQGRYTVVWRTAAADGHATSSRFSFTMLNAAAVAAPHPTPPQSAAVPQTPGSNVVVDVGTPPTFSTGFRWAELVAVITMIGAIIFRLAVLPAAHWSDELMREAGERTRRLAQAALTLFIVATLTRIVAQSALVPNEAGGRTAAVLAVVRDTRWGHGWSVGAAGAIVVLVGLVVARVTVAGWAAAAVGVVAVCTGDALTGHAVASHHFALAIATDITHYLGAGGWIGGLIAVLLSGLPSLRAVGESERPVAGAQLVRAYHGAAIECVALVLASAVVAAWLRLGRLSALWTTTYGELLLLKIALVCVILLFGWYHWQRIVAPDWDSDTKFRFQRTATMELIVGVIVLAVTAVLVSTGLPQ